MENKKLKIAIIGGGIIGTYLAWKLGERGHDVSVFEKKSEKDAGKKVCSALFSERIIGFIPQASECVKNEISGCVINFPKKKIKLNFSPKHLVLNREKLLATLISLARETGAHIIFNQEIKELPQDFDYIIGCDGAGSIVRNKLELPKPVFSLGIRAYFRQSDNSNFVSTCPTRSGFLWKIPKGDCVEYGAMGDLKETKKIFDDFLKRENINTEESASAIIPQPGNYFVDSGLIFTNENNIALCGDATGLTKPWSGGGIIWGLTQAGILLKTFPNFKEYKKEVIKKFGRQILKGKISKRLVYLFGNYFPYILPSEITYDNDFPSIFASLISLFA
ncbi:MAG: NAD(P)-binding protein [Candidatus Pacebacteria bacterium]|nr:NAD(P)-binding protein [Candidatus Paceibacterota bacterium]